MSCPDMKGCVPSLLIRADATPTIGTGHVMRCLALAQAAMSQGLTVRILGRTAVPWVRERLKQEGIDFTELTDAVPTQEKPENLLAQLASSQSKGWLVLDGYHFGTDCHKAVRAAGYKLLVIDDYAHLPEYSCDILLNQNVGAEGLVYKGDIGMSLFGPRYALLRPEFAAAREKTEKRIFSERPRNLLLTLGGGDFSAYLRRIAPSFALPELKECSLRVIAGSMPEAAIKESLADCPAELEIVHRVDDMAALLLETDLCVTAGGSTCWELCCLGVPFLTVELAENQKNIVAYLEQKAIAPKFNKATLSEYLRFPENRNKSSVACKKTLDGRGAMRVATQLAALPFSLRTVRKEDSMLIFALANDPLVRSISFSPHQISEEEHQKWFSLRIQKSSEPFYIAYADDQFIGYARFDLVAPETVTISVAVVSDQRGKGLGATLICQTCRLVFTKGFRHIKAWVLDSNRASQKTFIRAGFRSCGIHQRQGRECFLFQKSVFNGEPDTSSRQLED